MKITCTECEATLYEGDIPHEGDIVDSQAIDKRVRDHESTCVMASRRKGAPCPHTNFVRLGYLGPFMTGISSTKINWACCRHCRQFFATSFEDSKANERTVQ